MDSMEEGFVCKAKSIISSLFGILLWSSRLPSSPIDLPKDQSPTHNQDHQSFQLGLKTLVTSEVEAFSHHSRELQPHTIVAKSYNVSSLPSASFASLSRSSSYLSQSSSLSLDDLIGSDSGVHMSTEEDMNPSTRFKSTCYNCKTLKKNPVIRKSCCVKESHYPPPIPSLARTGSLPGRMPWVMTRQYDQGRLILSEERAKHQEYFDAHRENGRLILKLVPLEDSISVSHSINGIEKCHNDLAEDETTYGVIEEEITHNVTSPLSLPHVLPHIEEGIERDIARKLHTYSGRAILEFPHLLTQVVEADQENETLKLKAHQPSSAATSFSVCPMTTVP